MFQSFNRYLGVAVGEHLGYLLTGAWTTLTGIALTQTTAASSWVGVLVIVIGPVLMLCSLEFVGRHEPAGWTLAGRLTPITYPGHAARGHRLLHLDLADGSPTDLNDLTDGENASPRPTHRSITSLRITTSAATTAPHFGPEAVPHRTDLTYESVERDLDPRADPAAGERELARLHRRRMRRERLMPLAPACQTDSVSAHVKFSGELSGEYLVDEVLDDGRIVLRPDTSAAAISQRAGLTQVSDEEFENAFGHLPTDDEG